MKEDEIRRIVRATIRELTRQEMIDQERMAYSEITARLETYFSGAEDIELEAELEKIKRDEYFDVIPMIFEDGCTIEQVAEAFERDDRTIKRNKKRLCLKLYKELKK